MAKLFHNEMLMMHITTFIHKDPRKRYADQEQKRQKVLQTLNHDLEEYPSKCICWNCEEPYYIFLSDEKRFYIKKDSGDYDTCMECMVEMEEE